MADDDLEGIVERALAEAREKGLDHLGQTGHAVRAVSLLKTSSAAEILVFSIESG